MSHLIRHAQAGDEITVIRPFSVCQKGERFSWDNAKHFNVGDRVDYIGFRPNERRDWYDRADPFHAWLVEFEAHGVVYEAADDLFATEEEVADLRQHLLRAFITEEATRLRNQGKPADNSSGGLFDFLGGLCTILLYMMLMGMAVWFVCGMLGGCLGRGP